MFTLNFHNVDSVVYCIRNRKTTRKSSLGAQFKSTQKYQLTKKQEHKIPRNFSSKLVFLPPFQLIYLFLILLLSLLLLRSFLLTPSFRFRLLFIFSLPLSSSPHASFILSNAELICTVFIIPSQHRLLCMPDPFLVFYHQSC